MKRHLIALLGALAVLLGLGSGVAQAQSVQGVEQAAATGQSATSNASSTQTNPSNSNISVRIFSPGDEGSVSQSNTSAAGSAAINKAATSQAVGQSQAGAGTQAVGQSAETGQSADSSATSTQSHPTNSNIDVRIYSPGDGGKVEQSNTSAAGSLAANKAKTEQGVEQEQAGGCDSCHGSGAGVQAVGQKAVTGQEAKSEATSRQFHPRNENIGVRIGSPGSNGDVKQSNTSLALSAAGNLAETSQGVSQTQADGCKCSGDLVQAVGQKAFTGQKAESSAESTQKGASNKNVPVRIKSPGDDGSVEQSNKSVALSAALNAATTEQFVDQQQSGDCACRPSKKEDGYGGGMKDHGDYGDKKDHGHDGGGGARVQAVGQWAETWQSADSSATSEQFKPSNKNAPVRVKSEGGGGSVEQSNTSLAFSLAANRAETNQWVRQLQ